MKHDCVVQHTYSEFLGLIESRLEKRDIGFSYCRPFVGQGIPGSAAQCDGLRLFGGASPISDLEDNPQVPQELALVDDEGRWLAVRPDSLTYGLLFRPEMKPGMLEDIIMEARHNPPPNIGELLVEARVEWQAMQDVTNDDVVALVSELQLMRERRKMPVFGMRRETDA